MISVGWIKADDRGRIDYYLSRAALDETAKYVRDRGEAVARYYGGATANGPGRWLGRGSEALGMADTSADPEAFARAVLEGYVDGASRAKPLLRTHPDGQVAAEPFAATVRRLGREDRFSSALSAREWGGVSNVADRFGKVSAATVDKLARAAGIDPAELYGPQEWPRALELAGKEHQVDTRTAALDITMSVPKSVSLLYATTGDEWVRQTIVTEFHEAVKATLDYFDQIAATARRGSASKGTITEIGTAGLVAVGFVHDEARPTAGCKCGDPHLHEHVIVLNAAKGEDGEWSAVQHDRIAPAAKTGGHLFQAELRERLSRTLGVEWRPVANGLAEMSGVTDQQLRAFSKRRSEIEAEMQEAGEQGLRAGQVANARTKSAKRQQLDLSDRLDYWQTEAAAVGLTNEAAAGVLRASRNYAETEEQLCGDSAVILERLTKQASSFGRPELLRALADEARQGASRRVLEARADAILTDPSMVVPLAQGEGGLTSGDVRRSTGGRVYAYAIQQKWTTPAQLQLEAQLVGAAACRAGQGCAQLDGDLVDAVVRRQPFVLSEEQAAAVRGITTSGAGVDVLHAGAGSGKTSAVLGTVRQAYELAGYKVLGAATSARAARVLSDDGGIAARTVAKLLLDLERAGFAKRTVLILDEASMCGSRDLAPLLGHAERAGTKVIVTGDTRQLAAVDAGGGLRGLRDRLGAHELTANRRQHASWERDALASLAAGEPGSALRAYSHHDRVTVADSALTARAAMVRAWWRDVEDHGIDRTLLVAVRNSDRAALNTIARGVMRQAGRIGDDVVTAAGRGYAVGDRVMLLRNSSKGAYDNGDVATVTGAPGGRRLEVTLDRGPVEILSAAYLDASQLDFSYCTTVYKAQGSTVETAHVLGTALAKEDGYVALSRGRADNRLYLVQGEPEAEIDLPQQTQRSAYGKASASLTTSKAKTLAVDSRLSVVKEHDLVQELAAAARLLRERPANDSARLPALRAEVTKLEQQLATSARDHDQVHARLQTARAAVQAVEEGRTERDKWHQDHEPQLAAAAAAGWELAWRTKAAQTAARLDNECVVPTPQVEGLERSHQMPRRRTARLFD